VSKHLSCRYKRHPLQKRNSV